jgi:hypothetical protein
MSFVVALFGAAVVGLGLAGLASPARLLDLVSRAQTTLGLYLIAALRIFLGVAFWLAADASRAPLGLKVFGVLAFVAGVATPLFGLRRFAALVDWWRRQPEAVVRAWSALVAVFGASLVWAGLPRAGSG